MSAALGLGEALAHSSSDQEKSSCTKEQWHLVLKKEQGEHKVGRGTSLVGCAHAEVGGGHQVSPSTLFPL